MASSASWIASLDPAGFWRDSAGAEPVRLLLWISSPRLSSEESFLFFLLSFSLFLSFLLFLPDPSPDFSSDCGAKDCEAPVGPPVGLDDAARSFSSDLIALWARDRRARMSALSGNFCIATGNRSTASWRRPFFT